MIKVSVIIPVYNCEKYIEESLISLFAQNYQEFEIIIVNDGSTDGTLKLVSDVLNFSCVGYKIIDHNDNKGISLRRTEGVRASEGEYIVVHKTMLKIILNPILRKFGCSIVSYMDDNDRFIRYGIRSYPKNCKVIR
jgi:glycosyltransferase involved in cell wall biosynthesis